MASMTCTACASSSRVRVDICTFLQAGPGLRYEHLLIALMDDNPYLSDGSKQVKSALLTWSIACMLAVTATSVILPPSSACLFCDMVSVSTRLAQRAHSAI